MSRDFASTPVGTVLPAATVRLDRAALVRYAGASGDFNPIHWSERTARSAGLPDVIAHGMFTMGAVASTLTSWGDDPAAVLDYGTRFTKPVVVPDGKQVELAVAGEVTDADPETRRVVVTLTVRCGDDRVLSQAKATVQLS